MNNIDMVQQKLNIAVEYKSEEIIDKESEKKTRQAFRTRLFMFGQGLKDFFINIIIYNGDESQEVVGKRKKKKKEKKKGAQVHD